MFKLGYNQDYEGSNQPGGGYHYNHPNAHHPRFNPNYRFVNNQAGAPPYHGGGYNKFAPKNFSPYGHQQALQQQQSLPQAEPTPAPTEEITPGDISPPKSPSTTDPDLVNAVSEITTAVAAASAAGKELSLTQEQQAILQKHQLLRQQYEQKLQAHQQSTAANQAALLAKTKCPNYRLLGRNIFEPNVRNQFMKKKIKANTYYSRFIKQHPANNLPLAFQKSVTMAEEKARELTQASLVGLAPGAVPGSTSEGVAATITQLAKLKKKKKQKKNKSSDSDTSRSSSRSSSSSSRTSKSSKHDDDSDSSSSGSSSGESDSSKQKKSKKKSKAKKAKKVKEVAPTGEQTTNPEALGAESTPAQLEKKSSSDESSSSSSSSSSSRSSSSSSSSSDSDSDNDSRSKKKKQSRGKNAKRAATNKQKNQEGADSDGSMLDLKENLKPIGAYVKDRKRMLNEMFRCIKGAKLQAMLPDILKVLTYIFKRFFSCCFIFILINHHHFIKTWNNLYYI